MAQVITIAAGQGDVISEATVRLPLTAGSPAEATDRALTMLERHCKANGWTCAVEYFHITRDAGGYTVSYGSPASM